MRSTAGAGIGLPQRAEDRFYLNPASSQSCSERKTFLFNVGIEGNNTYSKTAEAKTSHNSFNVRDIAPGPCRWAGASGSASASRR